MGQRNATYVIVEDTNKYDPAKKIMAIYNQWNFVKLQSSKMVRGIKAVTKFNWRYNPIEVALQLYFTFAGDNSYISETSGLPHSEWVGGYDETDEYCANGLNNQGFCEDNNNGWNIVKFIIDEEGKVKTEIYCRVGSEDKKKAQSKDVDSYFYEYKNIEDLIYLKENTTWNKKLATEANRMLKELYVKNPAKVKKSNNLKIDLIA